jgi:ANTAR domain
MFARVARQLAVPTDLPSVSDLVVSVARAITGCDTAALWSLEPAREIRLSASTDPSSTAYRELLNAGETGVEWDCLRTASSVRVDDLRVEDRWPHYCQALLRSPVLMLSMAAFYLPGPGYGSSALVLGSVEAEYFTAELSTLADVFVDHATVGLARAAAQEKSANLQAALDSNRRIGIALGIIMSRLGCTEDKAFGMLRNASQLSHRKMREVAEDVILTGLIPEPKHLVLRSVADRGTAA